jgi:Holliday junction resolvase RusA-like endonuclease
MISFVVYGRSQPAGSKGAYVLRRRDGSLVTRPDGGPIVNVTDANKKSKEWKGVVAWTARKAYQGPLLDGPLHVRMTFFRPRPKGHFRKSGELSKEGLATPAPTGKPDVLKLSRAVEDALTEVVWRDDALIVTEDLAKWWGEPARVEVMIAPWAGTPPPYHGAPEPEPF